MKLGRRQNSLIKFPTLRIRSFSFIVLFFLFSSQSGLYLYLYQRSLSNTSWSTTDVPKNHENTTGNHLRFDWTSLEVTSSLAKRIKQHQDNCSLPMGRFWFRNRFGLGSDLHVWSQGLCNAMALDVRIKSTDKWIWNDIEVCGNNTDGKTKSPLKCYFPRTEPVCPDDDNKIKEISTLDLAKGRGKVSMNCEKILSEGYTVSDFRAASTEYLFSGLSTELHNEADRQIKRVFHDDQAPPDLITVHVRWGDKVDEMKLVPIHEYISAVEELISDRPRLQVNIFLATEDPAAVAAFQAAAPSDWNIYLDFYFSELLPDRISGYNGNPKMAVSLMGKPGLVALGSLLVSMEANDFVLTTKSNWSRLINELRANVVDPSCEGCTRVKDLRFGE